VSSINESQNAKNKKYLTTGSRHAGSPNGITHITAWVIYYVMDTAISILNKK